MRNIQIPLKCKKINNDKDIIRLEGYMIASDITICRNSAIYAKNSIYEITNF